MDIDQLEIKLAHHRLMFDKLEHSKPELALIWLAGIEILEKKLAMIQPQKDS
jgi:hypothetical protein